jgi:hypothetical protein
MTYLAWIGNINCTYGTPHKTTGRYDKHGELKLFKTKAERDLYCDQYNHHYNMYPVKTNKRDAKAKYFAGCTQAQFNDYLIKLEFIYEY